MAKLYTVNIFFWMYVRGKLNDTDCNLCFGMFTHFFKPSELILLIKT